MTLKDGLVFRRVVRTYAALPVDAVVVVILFVVVVVIVIVLVVIGVDVDLDAGTAGRR